MGLGMGVVCCTGLFAALVVHDTESTSWMLKVGGLLFGAPALLLAIIANISAASIMMYTAGLGLRHVPLFRGMQWPVLMGIAFTPVLAYVVWPNELYTRGMAFLAYNATMYAPISGLLLVDYFWLRRQRLNASQIFTDDPRGHYWFNGGFNFAALVCLALGYVIYLYLFNPATTETRGPFAAMTASVPATVIPMLLYYCLSRAFIVPSGRGGYGASTHPAAMEQCNL